MDPSYEGSKQECRTIFGLTLEQRSNDAIIILDLHTNVVTEKDLPATQFGTFSWPALQSSTFNQTLPARPTPGRSPRSAVQNTLHEAGRGQGCGTTLPCWGSSSRPGPEWWELMSRGWFGGYCIQKQEEESEGVISLPSQVG